MCITVIRLKTFESGQAELKTVSNNIHKLSLQLTFGRKLSPVVLSTFNGSFAEYNQQKLNYYIKHQRQKNYDFFSVSLNV